jgi:hypothetical protein
MNEPDTGPQTMFDAVWRGSTYRNAAAIVTAVAHDLDHDDEAHLREMPEGWAPDPGHVDVHLFAELVRDWPRLDLLTACYYLGGLAIHDPRGTHLEEAEHLAMILNRYADRDDREHNGAD